MNSENYAVMDTELLWKIGSEISYSRGLRKQQVSPQKSSIPENTEQENMTTRDKSYTYLHKHLKTINNTVNNNSRQDIIIIIEFIDRYILASYEWC